MVRCTICDMLPNCLQLKTKRSPLGFASFPLSSKADPMLCTEWQTRPPLSYFNCGQINTIMSSISLKLFNCRLWEQFVFGRRNLKSFVNKLLRGAEYRRLRFRCVYVYGNYIWIIFLVDDSISSTNRPRLWDAYMMQPRGKIENKLRRENKKKVPSAQTIYKTRPL